MKPVMQTIYSEKGKPAPEFANCFQACVASLLELPLEEVPNFMLFRAKWWEAVVFYFGGLGYDIGYVDIPPPENGEFYIGSIDYSDRDYCHAVIVKDGAVVHDPHPIDGPLEAVTAHYWISNRWRRS
jgi:hypothetical protein